jgi:hypothetical protein
LAKQCYEASGASGIWAVDSSLSDQEGSGTFDKVRFPAIIKLHEELNALLPNNKIAIAGPYWGLNLVLWARGLITNPAVGLGNTYQYHLPGGLVMKQGKTRVALPPLRRWAVASSQLKSWLQQSIAKLSPGDSARTALEDLEMNFSKLQIQGREQIAGFYRDWLNELETVPQQGRALALYQQLSSAFVLGRGLPELPKKDEQAARRPERVAKQLMLVCL